MELFYPKESFPGVRNKRAQSGCKGSWRMNATIPVNTYINPKPSPSLVCYLFITQHLITHRYMSSPVAETLSLSTCQSDAFQPYHSENSDVRGAGDGPGRAQACTDSGSAAREPWEVAWPCARDFFSAMGPPRSLVYSLGT